MQERQDKNPWVAFGRYASLGFSFGITMTVTVFLGFFGGRWLDRHLGTEPVLMIVGMLLGAALAFKNLIDELSTLAAKEGKKKNGTDQNPG